MALTKEQALVEYEDNKPEVKVGQVWKLPKDQELIGYPLKIRIVGPYQADDEAMGRAWVYQDVKSIQKLRRITELTLRQIYKLPKK